MKRVDEGSTSPATTGTQIRGKDGRGGGCSRSKSQAAHQSRTALKRDPKSGRTRRSGAAKHARLHAVHSVPPVLTPVFGLPHQVGHPDPAVQRDAHVKWDSTKAAGPRACWPVSAHSVLPGSVPELVPHVAGSPLERASSPTSPSPSPSSIS